MRERQFAGYLNSKSVYGQSYSDYSVLRLAKYDKVQACRKGWSKLWMTWNKRSKLHRPSWSKSLWALYGDIAYSDRMWNQGRVKKDKRIKLMKWRKRC